MRKVQPHVDRVGHGCAKAWLTSMGKHCARASPFPSPKKSGKVRNYRNSDVLFFMSYLQFLWPFKAPVQQRFGECPKHLETWALCLRLCPLVLTFCIEIVFEKNIETCWNWLKMFKTLDSVSFTLRHCAAPRLGLGTSGFGPQGALLLEPHEIDEIEIGDGDPKGTLIFWTLVSQKKRGNFRKWLQNLQIKKLEKKKKKKQGSNGSQFSAHRAHTAQLGIARCFFPRCFSVWTQLDRVLELIRTSCSPQLCPHWFDGYSMVSHGFIRKLSYCALRN